MIRDLEQLIEKVKPYLKDYLIDKGVAFSEKGGNTWFRCIHPDHEDRNPSSSFVKGTDDQVFHCFSCGASGSILNARAFLEGKPRYGAGFLTDNLLPLLSQYKIEYEGEIAEETLHRYKFEDVYHQAYQTMVELDANGNLTHLDLTYANSRGWDTSICRRVGVGNIKDYVSFIKRLSTKTNLTVEELDRMGITRDLFDKELCTFCIRDHTGVVTGFVARYINFTKGCDKPKYRNTSVDSNPYYSKERTLFCLDLARTQKDHRLDIFEGYGSAITAHQEGYRNSCAIGGTALTQGHIDIILSLGFKHINLVLDQDDVGLAVMEKHLATFSGHRGLRVSVMNLPFKPEDDIKGGQNDPDYFINKYGIEAYKNIKPISAFEFMIQKRTNSFLPGSDEATAFCKQMIKLLVNEADLIERSQMTNILATHTGVNRDDIRDEVSRIERQDLNIITADIGKKIKGIKDPDDLYNLLNEAQDRLKDTNTSKQDRHLISVAETIETFESIFKEFETRKPGLQGWTTGYRILDSMLNGIAKPENGGKTYGFAGPSYHGKSTILLNLALNIATKNRDVAVLYLAIDENRNMIAERVLSNLSGVTLKQIRRQDSMTDDDEQKLRLAKEQFFELIKDRTLEFKDDTLGRSKMKVESWIKRTQDETSKHVLLCIDSIHNLDSLGNSSEERIRVKNVSTFCDSICTRLKISLMGTLEMVKNIGDEKPGPQHIAESGKLMFDFDHMGIVWNEQKGRRIPIEQCRAKWGLAGNYKPVIELDLCKNRSTYECGSVFFPLEPSYAKLVDALDVYPESSTMEEVVTAKGSTYRYDS